MRIRSTFKAYFVLLVVLGLAAMACSSSSDSAQATPTDQVLPATVLPTSTSLPTATAVPVATATSAPTATLEPIATVAPTSTTAPAPSATAAPTATAVPPTPTAVVVPTATSVPNPTATPSPAVWVGCRIEPSGVVKVGDVLTYTALQNPVTIAINFAFDHGDGTIDPGPVSQAFYQKPGLYDVRLQWSYAGTSGTTGCGQVRVVAEPGAPTPTPTPAPPVSISCKVEPARSVIVGEILTYTASQFPATIPIQYVFDHGDGTLDPGPISKAFYEAPGFYGVTLNWSYEGRAGVINCGRVTVLPAPGTPTPTPTATSAPVVAITCQISPDGAVAVNQRLTFTASQNPPQVPVQYIFDHGDGTLDPGPVSSAFYRTAGSYAVRLNWAHSGQTGQILCGVVTVTS